jgi:DNA invertase Pin-like site-specific DNA recombinase
MKYGYVRVSTREQNEDRQINALKDSGVSASHIYTDKISGKSMDRPAWNKLLVKVVAGDTIVVKELDRLGRNLKQIKETYELLGKKKVHLQILDNDILSTANKSKVEIELLQPMLLHLLGYIAEKEREKLLKRQREGIEAMEINDKGKKVSKRTRRETGRPSKRDALTKDQERHIDAWISKSIKLADCIKLTELSKATLYRIKSGCHK